MRRIAAMALAGAALLLIAAAPGAGPGRHAQITVPRQPPSAASGLRGAQGPARPGQAQAKTPLLPPANPVAALTPAFAQPLQAVPPVAAVDAGQCRRACARPYYFCLAGDDADSCPTDWSRCVSACDRGPAR